MKTGTENMTTQALDTFVTKRRPTSKICEKNATENTRKATKGQIIQKKNAKSVGGYWLIGYY